ncbi:Peroxisomal membrane signal receptor PTS1 [Exophiala xenobiotica]|nr:Peroxisomal membrane signal receptor PTS1 [Exophiala xenobiotica]KAK5234653.1 Peroxisomal membrane signal receptor PTS1 [Exophiala xenobiotica]KAK5246749.1 Peroxisomal membrane signal receptor PTS1 [Exophiala xenobiotica]KAK5281627.1 Peroxisomal membrane signal receptor PTS1 [Exophiala xenobiotica]KAK5326370.1 Peroxisomal membrane signal receptor PTS1 [Exophiala xenobiotica]
MSFLGGAECSTAGNPLTQFTKHVQSDNTLQRDRLVGRGSGGLEEGMRSFMASNPSDKMINDFLNQSGPLPQPFAMEQLRQDLPNLQSMTRRSPSPGWAPEIDPSEQARFEALFHSTRHLPPPQRPAAFSPQEFARFQQPSPRTASPIAQTPSSYRPMGSGYMNGGMGMGMNYGNQYMQHQPDQTTDKGKGRMVELDDANWEAHFKELETQHDNLSEQANQAMEKELEEIDRSVNAPMDNFEDFETVWHGISAEHSARQMTEDAADFDNAFSSEDYAAWDNFDSTMGLGTHNPFEREPMLGDYMFEAQNPYLEVDESEKTAFEYGKEILESHGNLSLAALAFEAAVQKESGHIEAWVLLGAAQAQNEKEAPAIRALETAVRLDPNNLDALMSLAVSYTNEGYDSTAYRTLERWLSVKYPHIHPPQDLSESSEVGFTDRILLHAKVVKLFIKAAQLSPSGEKMDPDVQVGLGVLFYGNEDFEKAVDCFRAALESTETGLANRQGQVHLLWNRLGATLANSGRSEDAISAYCKALEVNPNFVRARYNLGVSCINIGCYPEAAGHLLGALNLHRVVGDQGMDQAREILAAEGSGGIGDAELERMIQQNESTNLYDTLRRAFTGMGRRDLTERVGAGMNLDQFRGEFEF